MTDLKETITDLFVQLNPRNQAGFLQKMREFDVYSKIDLSEDEFVSVTDRKKLKLKITKLFTQLNPKHQQGFLDQMQAISMASSVSSPSSTSSTSSTSSKKRPFAAAFHLKIAPSKRQRLSGGGGRGRVEQTLPGIFGEENSSDEDEDEDEDEDGNGNGEENVEKTLQGIFGADNSDDNVMVKYYTNETETIFNDDIIEKDLMAVLSSESDMFRHLDKLRYWVRNLIQFVHDVGPAGDGKQPFTTYPDIDDELKPISLTKNNTLVAPLEVQWVVPVIADTPLTENDHICDVEDPSKRFEEESASSGLQMSKLQKKVYYQVSETFAEKKKKKQIQRFVEAIVVDEDTERFIASFLVAASPFQRTTGSELEVVVGGKDELSAKIPTLSELVSRQDVQAFLQQSLGFSLRNLKHLALKSLQLKDFEVTSVQKLAFLQNLQEAVEQAKQAVEMEQDKLEDAEKDKEEMEDYDELMTVGVNPFFLAGDPARAAFFQNKQQILKTAKSSLMPNPFASLTTLEPALLDKFFDDYGILRRTLLTKLKGSLQVFKDGSTQLATPAAAAAAAVSLAKPKESSITTTTSRLYDNRPYFDTLEAQLEQILSRNNVKQLEIFLKKHTVTMGDWYREKTTNQNILCIHRYNTAHSVSNAALFEYKEADRICRVCKESVEADLQFADLVHDEEGRTKDFNGETGVFANGRTMLGSKGGIGNCPSKTDGGGGGYRSGGGGGDYEELVLEVSVYKNKDLHREENKMEITLNKLLNKTSALALYKKFFLIDQDAKKKCIDACVEQQIKEDLPLIKKQEILQQVVKQTPLPPAYKKSCVEPTNEALMKTFSITEPAAKQPPVFYTGTTVGLDDIEEAISDALNIDLPEIYKDVLQMPRIASEFQRHYTKLAIALKDTEKLDELRQSQEYGYMFKPISNLYQIDTDIGTKFEVGKKPPKKSTTPPNLVEAFEEEELPPMPCSTPATLASYVFFGSAQEMKKKLLVLFVHNMAKREHELIRAAADAAKAPVAAAAAADGDGDDDGGDDDDGDGDGDDDDDDDDNGGELHDDGNDNNEDEGGFWRELTGHYC